MSLPKPGDRVRVLPSAAIHVSWHGVTGVLREPTFDEPVGRWPLRMVIDGSDDDMTLPVHPTEVVVIAEGES